MYFGDAKKIGKNGTKEIGLVTPTPGDEPLSESTVT